MRASDFPSEAKCQTMKGIPFLVRLWSCMPLPPKVVTVVKGVSSADVTSNYYSYLPVREIGSRRKVLEKLKIWGIELIFGIHLPNRSVYADIVRTDCY